MEMKTLVKGYFLQDLTGSTVNYICIPGLYFYDHSKDKQIKSLGAGIMDIEITADVQSGRKLKTSCKCRVSRRLITALVDYLQNLSIQY